MSKEHEVKARYKSKIFAQEMSVRNKNGKGQIDPM